MKTLHPNGSRVATALAGLTVTVGLCLTGCSSSGDTGVTTSSTSAAAPTASATTSSSATGSPTATSSPTKPAATSSPTRGTPTSTMTIRTTSTADCRTLSAASAKALLGSAVSNHKDRRAAVAGREQLDGCVYTTAGQARLSYVVWQLPRTAQASDLTSAAVPAGSGAEKFKPTVPGATVAEGVVLPMGELTSVQLGAAKGRLVVEVSVQAGEAAAARAAAVRAAAELLK